MKYVRPLGRSAKDPLTVFDPEQMKYVRPLGRSAKDPLTVFDP
jgi:hypothetical protein